MPNLCKRFWQCPDCGVNLKVEHRKPELHECGEIECNICHEFYFDENHQCYMRALAPKQEKFKFIFRIMKILNIYPILLLPIVCVMSVKKMQLMKMHYVLIVDLGVNCVVNITKQQKSGKKIFV